MQFIKDCFLLWEILKRKNISFYVKFNRNEIILRKRKIQETYNFVCISNTYSLFVMNLRAKCIRSVSIWTQRLFAEKIRFVWKLVLCWTSTFYIKSSGKLHNDQCSMFKNECSMLLRKSFYFQSDFVSHKIYQNENITFTIRIYPGQTLKDEKLGGQIYKWSSL